MKIWKHTHVYVVTWCIVFSVLTWNIGICDGRRQHTKTAHDVRIILMEKNGNEPRNESVERPGVQMDWARTGGYEVTSTWIDTTIPPSYVRYSPRGEQGIHPGEMYQQTTSLWRVKWRLGGESRTGTPTHWRSAWAGQLPHGAGEKR